jgi:hypothetical protein
VAAASGERKQTQHTRRRRRGDVIRIRQMKNAKQEGGQKKLHILKTHRNPLLFYNVGSWGPLLFFSFFGKMCKFQVSTAPFHQLFFL